LLNFDNFLHTQTTAHEASLDMTSIPWVFFVLTGPPPNLCQIFGIPYL